MNRLRELDFLRGIAILLVLLRHVTLFSFTSRMGWIGVDLFFVLSGFLVSRLLFKEFIKYGNIRPKLFLIRRGFKIYPIYYLFYIPYLALILYRGRFNLIYFLSDMTFTQNYVHGWGYAYGASWSLAIEEHFYFGLSFFLWAGLHFQKIKLVQDRNKQFSFYSFETSIVSILVLCLLLRLMFNFLLDENQTVELFTATQFRMDSLLMGVLISFFYHFRLEHLKKQFWKYKYLLLLISFVGLSWTPFVDHLFFVTTAGFTLVYVSFGVLLVFILLQDDINKLLNKTLSSVLVNAVSRIGYCSYSIYIIHLFVISVSKMIINHYQWLSIFRNKYTFFTIATTLSIFIGMLMTYSIEKYFLRLRNIYYPSRI